jgi:hypothetical protein
VGAAELGDARVGSHAGQQLVADIELTSVEDATRPVQVRLASPDVYQGANLVMPPVLSSLNMNVMRRDLAQAGRRRPPAPVCRTGGRRPQGGAPRHALVHARPDAACAGARVGANAGAGTRAAPGTETGRADAAIDTGRTGTGTGTETGSGASHSERIERSRAAARAGKAGAPQSHPAAQGAKPASLQQAGTGGGKRLHRA